MPTLWEAVVEVVLGPLATSQEPRGCCLAIPHVAARSDSVERRCARMPPLRKGECGQRFSYVMWSSDMLLMAEEGGHIQVMRSELAVGPEGLAIKWENIHCWSSCRPDGVMSRRTSSWPRLTSPLWV